MKVIKELRNYELKNLENNEERTSCCKSIMLRKIRQIWLVGVFPHGGSHQRVNLYACSLSQMVMREDTEIYPGSGKRKPYVQQGREVCIILHLSACTGANTSVV